MKSLSPAGKNTLISFPCTASWCNPILCNHFLLCVTYALWGVAPNHTRGTHGTGLRERRRGVTLKAKVHASNSNFLEAENLRFCHLRKFGRHLNRDASISLRRRHRETIGRPCEFIFAMVWQLFEPNNYFHCS